MSKERPFTDTMKRRIRVISRILAVSLCYFWLLSCSDGFLFSCSFAPYLRLGDEEPSAGVVGVGYNFTIMAGVENDPDDEDYDYWFTISGNLPPGLVRTDSGRYLVLAGIPETAGDYAFQVKVLTPEYENDDGDECYSSFDWKDQRDYVISIREN